MQTPFSHRPPSAHWEPLPILPVPGLMLWVWYRPQHLPLGLMVSVPPEVLAAYPAGFPFTLSQIFLAAGVEPTTVHFVSCFGSEWQAADVFGPLLNHTMSPVVWGVQPEIAIQVRQQTVPDVSAMGQREPNPVTGIHTDTSAEEQPAPDDADPGSQKLMYDRIDKAWRSSIQMERQMTGLRQKLASVMAALDKLDRDLNSNERLAAERADRDAWQDARRWMRDLCAKCHREIKSFDIGMTSAAGRRNSMEQLYRQWIEPRARCTDLPSVRREFEVYRRDMLNLQKSMQAVLMAARQNGTERAHRVLSEINRKIRERRARMREAIGGVNLDKSVRRNS